APVEGAGPQGGRHPDAQRDARLGHLHPRRLHPAHHRPHGPQGPAHRHPRRGADRCGDGLQPREGKTLMTGMILDGVLMLLLVAALGYGVRLERKLTTLREGQQAFASAVGELNAAAGRAEAALASLRASGQETDLLHDRIIKAREVKAQLEALIARGPVSAPAAAEPVRAAPAPAPVQTPAPVAVEDERAV